MKLSRIISMLACSTWLLALHGCAGSLDQIDPVVYVDGVSCPDESGKPVPLVAGWFCCSDQNMGPGACEEGTSCMLPDGCSSPLPDNDPSAGYGARRLTRRTGL